MNSAKLRHIVIANDIFKSSTDFESGISKRFAEYAKNIDDATLLEKICDVLKEKMEEKFDEDVKIFQQDIELNVMKFDLEKLDKKLSKLSEKVVDVKKENHVERDKLLESHNDELEDLEMERMSKKLRAHKTLNSIEAKISDSKVEFERLRLEKIEAYAKDVEEENYQQLVNTIKNTMKKIYKMWRKDREKINTSQLKPLIDKLEINGNAVLEIETNADDSVEHRKEIINELLGKILNTHNDILDLKLIPEEEYEEIELKLENVDNEMFDLSQLALSLPNVELVETGRLERLLGSSSSNSAIQFEY